MPSKTLAIVLLVLCILAIAVDGRKSKATTTAKVKQELIRGLLIMTDSQSLSPAVDVRLDGKRKETAIAGVATSVFGPMTEKAINDAIAKAKADALAKEMDEVPKEGEDETETTTTTTTTTTTNDKDASTSVNDETTSSNDKSTSSNDKSASSNEESGSASASASASASTSANEEVAPTDEKEGEAPANEEVTEEVTEENVAEEEDAIKEKAGGRREKRSMKSQAVKSKKETAAKGNKETAAQAPKETTAAKPKETTAAKAPKETAAKVPKETAKSKKEKAAEAKAAKAEAKSKENIEQYNTYLLFMKDPEEMTRTLTQKADAPYNGVQVGERRISVYRGGVLKAREASAAEDDLWTTSSMVIASVVKQVSALPQEITLTLTDDSTLDSFPDMKNPTVGSISISFGGETVLVKYSAEVVQWDDEEKTVVLTMDGDLFNEQAKHTRDAPAANKPLAVSVRLDFVATRDDVIAPPPIVVPTPAPGQARFWMSRGQSVRVQFALQAAALNHPDPATDNGPVLAIVNVIILLVLTLLIFGTFAFGMGTPYAYEMGVRARLVNSYVGEKGEPVVQPPSPMMPVPMVASPPSSPPPSSPPAAPQVVVNNNTNNFVPSNSSSSPMLPIFSYN